MSVTLTESTEYHDTKQTVVHGIGWLRIDGLRESGFRNLRVNVGFHGCVGETEGVVLQKSETLSRAEVVSMLTAEEIAAGRTFIAALERIASAKNSELKEGEHDDTDVFA